MPETLSFKDLVVDAAEDLGCHLLRFTSNASSNSNVYGAHSILEIMSLKDKTIDNQKFRHHYVALDSDLSTWRTVKSTTVADDGLLQLTRGFAAQVNNNTSVHIFQVLDPEEWMNAGNNGLQDKWVPSRFYVPFADGEPEYNLTAVAPWLRSEGQILRIRERDERDGRVTETEMPVTYVQSDEGTITLLIPKVYAREGRGLLIEARRYYSRVTDWSATINLVSDRLVRASVKHEALKLIFLTLGQQARGYFGQAMVLAEKELAEQEARWQATVVKRDWQTEETRSSGGSTHDWAWGNE